MYDYDAITKLYQYLEIGVIGKVDNLYTLMKYRYNN